MGPRELADKTIVAVSRHTFQKSVYSVENLNVTVHQLLQTIQQELFDRLLPLHSSFSYVTAGSSLISSTIFFLGPRKSCILTWSQWIPGRNFVMLLMKRRYCLIHRHRNSAFTRSCFVPLSPGTCSCIAMVLMYHGTIVIVAII